MGIEGDFRIMARRECENPPCVRVCHTDSLEMKPEGRVVFHKEKCTNCGKCEKACLICAIPKGSEGMPIKCITVEAVRPSVPQGVLKPEEIEA